MRSPTPGFYQHLVRPWLLHPFIQSGTKPSLQPQKCIFRPFFCLPVVTALIQTLTVPYPGPIQGPSIQMSGYRIPLILACSLWGCKTTPFKITTQITSYSHLKTLLASCCLWDKSKFFNLRYKAVLWMSGALAPPIPSPWTLLSPGDILHHFLCPKWLLAFLIHLAINSLSNYWETPGHPSTAIQMSRLFSLCNALWKCEAHLGSFNNFCWSLVPLPGHNLTQPLRQLRPCSIQFWPPTSLILLPPLCKTQTFSISEFSHLSFLSDTGFLQTNELCVMTSPLFST